MSEYEIPDWSERCWRAEATTRRDYPILLAGSLGYDLVEAIRREPDLRDCAALHRAHTSVLCYVVLALHDRWDALKLAGMDRDTVESLDVLSKDPQMLFVNMFERLEKVGLGERRRLEDLVVMLVLA